MYEGEISCGGFVSGDYIGRLRNGAGKTDGKGSFVGRGKGGDCDIQGQRPRDTEIKGAFLVGGAYGKGEVYEKNKMVGYCSMSQATLGFSFGGEYFREIVFFRDKTDLDQFKAEEFTFSAQVTGVAATVGAAAKADYKAGMAVFITTDKGLMVDASLGGQKFKYLPEPNP
jgi:hypothetical protein